MTWRVGCLCRALTVTVNGTGKSELSQEPGRCHSTLQHVWPLLDEPALLLCPTADNGYLTAESSNLVLDADGVERQEKASLASLFNWAGALFESQQHAMH